MRIAPTNGQTGREGASVLGIDASTQSKKMAALEKGKHRLTNVSAVQPEPPAQRLHPRLSDLYTQKISALSGTLNAPDLRGEVTEILRGLLALASSGLARSKNRGALTDFRFDDIQLVYRQQRNIRKAV